MRFSETLRFNANPDWWVYYIPYDELKLLVEELRHLHNVDFFSRSPSFAAHIRPPTTRRGDDSTDDDADIEAPSPVRRTARTIQRSASRKVLADMHALQKPGYGAALESAPITHLPTQGEPKLDVHGTSHSDTRFEELDAIFFEKLDKHANTADELYKRLLEELKRITAGLQRDSSTLLETRIREVDPQEVEHLPLLSSVSESPRRRRRDRDRRKAELNSLKSRLIEHYKELGETFNFATLNKNGFDKILKKHDKYTERQSRATFMARLLEDISFTDTFQLERLQAQTEKIYADIFENGEAQVAREKLREGLRDLIVWDRNTIWRDVLRTERKVSAFHSVKGGAAVGMDGPGKVQLQIRPFAVFLALLAFVIILFVPGLVNSLPVDGGQQYPPEVLSAAHRCLALVACVVILWALEGVPLYVASFLVFPGTVLLGVFLNEENQPLSPVEASSTLFERMSSPTLMLIICVYTLGAALSKFEVDKLAANVILSRIRRPQLLLLTVMFLAVLISMFVSNVAAPVLLNSVMMPTIDALRQHESNRQYVRCLLLGIMIASNIGGFASPISSPQSAVALGLLVGEHRISFGKWLVVAIPQCVIMVLACFVVLCFLYKPNRYALPPLPRVSETLRWPHWVIIGSIAATIIIWSDHALQDLFGSAGVVAVIPVLIFFGSGILSKEDFNNLPWDVVYLVAGGIVLGSAVDSCKLLDLVAERLTHEIGTSNLFRTYLVFCIFLALVANAVSHTVSSIIVLPLVYKIGISAEGVGHPQLLVLGGTIAASCAMALPISSFPNISATRVEDERGVPYLTADDILKVGSIMTAVVTVVLVTFGYELMLHMLD